jgi:hypothetical protein
MPPDVVTASRALSPFPFLAWMELRIGLRAGLFRFAALLIFALGWSVGRIGGRGAGMSAYAAGETACETLGAAVALWVALGALRDAALHTEALILTKPQPPERLSLARFCGLYGQILCFLLALFAGAMAGRLSAEASLLGFPAYGLQYLRAAGVLFFVACASYCLALLGDSPIAGAVIALYWIVAMAGRQYLGKAYFPWYQQNLPAYMLFGVAMLGSALWFSRRRLRGKTPAALWVRALSPVALLLGGWLLWNVIRNGHDPSAIENPNLERVALQTINEGERTPGFLLPDQYGRQTSLSQFPGRILLVALWSPRDPDSTLLLARLEALQQRYGKQNVQPVAICLSEDASAATTFAVGERLHYPLVYDWGTYNGPRQQETSPTALAYRADSLPRLVITDRRHRVRKMLDDLTSYEGVAIEEALRQRLAEEPE